MKLYHYSASFAAPNQKEKELDSDDLQECKAWLAKQLGRNNSPDAMTLYDNLADKPILAEFNEQDSEGNLR